VSLPQNWTTHMIDLFSEGRSDIEVIKALGITRKQFNSYYDRSQAFRDLVDWGRDLAEAWWVEQSRTNLGDKNFNTTLYKARMQKFYDWSDKVDTQNKNVNTEVDLKKLQQELADRLPEMMKLIPTEQVMLPRTETGD
jgi:site-specific recombinase XerD